MSKKDTDTVTVHLFKDNGDYKDDVYVSVNDKEWRVPRGVDYQLPAAAAAVLLASQKQDGLTAEMMDGLSRF